MFFQLLILMIALISLVLLFVIIFYALIFGAPYAPLAQNRIDTMVRLLTLRKGQKLVDLGSGDGRIVIEFAKRGIESHGYEINPVLVALSLFKIRKAGLQKKAFIHFKDFWSVNLSEFDAITLYGITHIMGRLEKKIKKECKPDVKIVTNYFRFPDLKAIRQENRVTLYKI